MDHLIRHFPQHHRPSRRALAFNAFTIARATYALGLLIALGVTSFDVTALAPAQ